MPDIDNQGVVTSILSNKHLQPGSKFNQAINEHFRVNQVINALERVVIKHLCKLPEKVHNQEPKP